MCVLVVLPSFFVCLFASSLQAQEAANLRAQLKTAAAAEAPNGDFDGKPPQHDQDGEEEEEAAAAAAEVKLSQIFRAIEANKKRLGVAQYSLSQPTLEQVRRRRTSDVTLCVRVGLQSR